jgi:hypothetical protein
MKITRFEEPELQFGASRHVDIRFGLMNYAPLDFDDADAPKRIRIGIVGSSVSIEGLRDWLERCRNEIPAKASRQPNLFPRFPGFNANAGFRAELVFDSGLERTISSADIADIVALNVRDEQKVVTVSKIVGEVRLLLEKKPDVIVCALPYELLNAFEPKKESKDIDKDEGSDDTSDTDSAVSSLDFHDLLKARCMSLPRACPLQLVLPGTYDSKKRRIGKSIGRDVRPRQDDATCAWNFHTALYYKANGVPWRLTHDPTKLQTCFVGVGFYRTLDKERIFASVAQVFNERGKGVVVRGEAAVYQKEDRQVHLDADASHALLCRALGEYRNEHKTIPARIVIHKTSTHSAAEIEGFVRAARDHRVEYCELLSLSKSMIRLFRNAEYPPLRGTFWSLDDRNHILYTRGSVEFYATYPGMYMPRSVLISCDRVEQTPRYLAEEVLALTKMNWNDTQFDGGMPITIRAARQVGSILKYAGINDAIPSQYSFYM